MPGTVQDILIRCGTPYCEWGHSMPDLSNEQVDLCYSEFQKHCIERHGLREWVSTLMFLDLEKWTLTAIKS